jgi:transketolase
MTTFMPEQDVMRSLYEVAQQLRADAVRCGAASSEDPASSLSSADLMAVLLARHLRYDFTNPDAPGNDHLIFSQGHASPLYYAMLRATGAISERELLTYRRPRSRLEGRPTPRLPWTDAATGSLGQGLPIGAGVAMAGKNLDRLPYRVWVLGAGSELAGGSVWEAAEHAAASGLDNLTLIVDVNLPGRRGPAERFWNTAAYAARFRAFGWRTLEIDGHDIEEIDRALGVAAAHAGAPSVILARTGGDPGAAAADEHEAAYDRPANVRPLPGPAEAKSELGGLRDLLVQVAPPHPVSDSHPVYGPHPVSGPVPVPRRLRVAARPSWRPTGYEPGSMVSTRSAVGQALAELGDTRPDVVVLDGDASGSARTSFFARAHPDRFFECYAAEQQLVATAVGMQVRGWVPFAATFGAFFSRAGDFIRMAAISRASIRLVGSHSGVNAGEEGPVEMALEDIAALRAVHGSTVLCPCDANQAAWLTGVLADLPGVSYLRTCRGETPVIYQPGEEFEVGGSRVLRSSPDDEVTLVGTGITVHEALAAADLLAEDGIRARVIDAYSVKPIDAFTLRTAALETGRIVTAEDHWPEGGLGDAVLSALTADPAWAGGGQPLPAVRKLAVRAMPGSATPDEQVQLAGIDMASIATAAVELVGADHA